MEHETPRRMRLLVATAIVALGLLSGCGDDTTASSAVPPASTAQAERSVLDFSARALDGGSVSGSSYAGKPVAFWFWAPG